MKIGLCTWSYNRNWASKRMTFEDIVKVCATKLKVGGIDIIADMMPKSNREYLLKVKKMCTDLQLAICCYSPGNNFGEPTAAARQKQVDHIKQRIDEAYVLGAPVVRIFSGWPPKDKAKTLWKPMVQCIKQCVPTAKAAGVVLAIEPHNDGGFLPSSKETLRLIKEINSPFVGINLDTGNYHDKDMYAALEKSITYAPHIHGKIHNITAAGKEVEFNYDKIFAMLKKTGYRGFFSVEYEGHTSEDTYVPVSINMVKKMAQKYEI
ncbi:MAG: sugar phosphate isomerase/epimerase [Candidatus Omnitrophica bacterium]|nr:sugar phosphate isomerase/epimerase [Candidatus Omnitrophota bacterium]